MKFCSALFLAIAVVVIIGNGVTNVFVIDVVDAKNASPELTSTALKLHNVYTNFPPHDTDLYDTLEVSSNATLSQITKSYRSLSRIFHPDKQKQKEKEGVVAKRRLQQIQRSYEILGNDNKRLLYHRYGLIDPNLAAFLLLGPKIDPKSYYQLLQQTSSSSHADGGNSKENAGEIHLFDKLDRELLQLMGYDDSTMDVIRMAMETNPSDDPSIALEDHRVRTVAAILVESIRPVVEGRLDTRLYAHSLANDCDRWKRLPLGAQIIRSVGRAYRHEGSDFLQRYKSLPNNNSWNKNNIDNNNNSKKVVHQLQTDLTIGLRQKWRTTKDFWTAAAVGGRLAMAERLYNKQEQQQQQRKRNQQQSTIEYHENEIENEDEPSYLPPMDDYGHDDDNVNSYESMEEQEEKHRESEKLKAQQTLLQALQIEALWKVVKIDLDRIIRRACAMILSGEYFFFPSHQSLNYPNNNNNNNNGIDSSGWVTSSGETIDLEHAIVAAAETIIMTGEIMVQQSKQGTSWKE